MGKGLYIGKQFDPATGSLGERVELDPTDLLTHALIVGMTGSGKTGLAVALIEETLRSGVPVLAIDPKGDLGNLLLLFDTLSPEEFAPWIDADQARRQGQDVAAAAAQAATTWRSGLQEWGLSAADVAALHGNHEAVVFTPGSNSGVPLNLLQSLDAPAVPFEQNEEGLREEIGAFVSGVLGLLGIDADPLSSRPHVFLSTLIEDAWRAGRGLTLEDLVGLVADPPFEKMGALPLESVYPRKERQSLMMALNTLLAAPRFESWREGQPLDIERMLHAADGRPRLSVVYTAHLADDERLFVTALILEKVKTWMRRQGGTSSLRALVYMDEIYGYFPPHPANPPPKRPLLTLLKQARAQGVAIVLATQNPVDLDYKGLANMGVWMVGKLQTRQDRDRLREGLLGAGMSEKDVDTLLDGARKRVFLLHDVHRPAPLLLHSRFAMSYLRGPLTRDEVERLMKDQHAAQAPATARARRGAEAPGAATAAPPLPAPWHHLYLVRNKAGGCDPYLMVKFSARYAKGGDEQVAVRAFPMNAESPAEVLDQEPIEVAEEDVTEDAPANVTYSALPPFLAGSGAAKAVEKALKDRLADKLATTVWFDPITQRAGQPGEDAEEFAVRLRLSGPGPDEAKLREKLESKKRALEAAEQEVSGRKKEKWFSVGAAILSNLPSILSGGRGLTRRGVSGVGGVLSKERMEDAAESRTAALRAEVAELDKQVTGLVIVDASRFEQREVRPARADVKVLRYELLWVR